MLGLLAAIASGLGYGCSALLSRDLSQRADAMTLTTATSVVGALALLPLTVAGGLAFPVRADTAGLLAYLGVVTTAIAYALFYGGLQTVPGSVAAVVTLLEPLTAALLAVLILGEPLAGASIAGGVLLLGAVAVLYLRPTDATPVRAVAPARPALTGLSAQVVHAEQVEGVVRVDLHHVVAHSEAVAVIQAYRRDLSPGQPARRA